VPLICVNLSSRVTGDPAARSTNAFIDTVSPYSCTRNCSHRRGNRDSAPRFRPQELEAPLISRNSDLGSLKSRVGVTLHQSLPLQEPADAQCGGLGQSGELGCVCVRGSGGLDFGLWLRLIWTLSGLLRVGSSLAVRKRAVTCPSTDTSARKRLRHNESLNDVSTIGGRDHGVSQTGQPVPPDLPAADLLAPR
jgi:hypothetical protein